MESVPGPWPSECVLDRLVRKSGGCSIYASTVLKFIDEGHCSPAALLDQILESSSSAASPSDSAPFAELDKIYLQILSTCPTSELPLLRRILGYIGCCHQRRCTHNRGRYRSISQSPTRAGDSVVTRNAISRFIQEKEGTVRIYLNHSSFMDFLHDKQRSKD